jgi:hypothetical protein
MKDALAAIQKLQRENALLEADLAKARGTSAGDPATTVQKAIGDSLRAAKPTKSASALIEPMLNANRARKALEDLPTAERVEVIDRVRRSL